MLLALGYGALALDGLRLLGPALALLVAGHGLFKPALHALAGALYRDDDPGRDSGFLLMHCILNAGAAVAPIIAEWARARWGWVAIFQVATLGMLVSAACFAASAVVLRPARAVAMRPASEKLASSEEPERMRACRQICPFRQGGRSRWSATAGSTAS